MDDLKDIDEQLTYADVPIGSTFDASVSIARLISAIRELAEFLRKQDRRIEHLEDAPCRDTERKMK